MTSAVIHYFDRWATSYDRDLTSFGYAVPQMLADVLPPFLPDAPQILDIGIGTGLSAAEIKSVLPQAHIFGIDASQKMLNFVADKNIAEDLRLCDAATQFLPYGDATFDAAIATGLLEFIENPVWLLQQAARVLKPGGLLMLAFETIDSAPLYKPGLVRGVIRHTPECAVVRRVHYTPIPRLYLKYLYHPQYVIQLAGAIGLKLQDRTTILAYTRPNGDQVPHDVLIFKKP